MAAKKKRAHKKTVEERLTELEARVLKVEEHYAPSTPFVSSIPQEPVPNVGKPA